MMNLSNLCRCPACLPSIPPDPATATPAEVAAHAEHLHKLAAIGALPDPAFQPYPQPKQVCAFIGHFGYHEKGPGGYASPLF